jgi:hypothetical protein
MCGFLRLSGALSFFFVFSSFFSFKWRASGESGLCDLLLGFLFFLFRFLLGEVEAMLF